MARFRPLAPVGGTVCAASPARNSRPYCMGSQTKLRNCSTSFLKMLPVLSVTPDGASRASNSSQIRSSDQSSTVGVGSHWKYSRCTFGDRVEISTNPRSEWA